MSKRVVLFLFGCVIAAALCWVSRMVVPFRQSDIPNSAEAQLFVHELRTFHSGGRNLDTAHIWFSFETTLPDAASYFARVDSAISHTHWRRLESHWRTLDSHQTFRLYVSPWTHTHQSEQRTEVTLTYEPASHRVTYDQRRRLSGSAALNLGHSPGNTAGHR